MEKDIKIETENINGKVYCSKNCVFYMKGPQEEDCFIGYDDGADSKLYKMIPGEKCPKETGIYKLEKIQ